MHIDQGQTDHLETRALPEGPGCPWYLFHRLFLSKDTGAPCVPIARGPHELSAP
ncbi:unnamed protein product, partial [Staurois parvus]